MSDSAAAFAHVAKARDAIANIVDSVRSGERDLDAAFVAADADPLIGRCFAVKVFEVVPNVGKVRARHTMDDLGLAEDLWLGDVPADKRVAIMAALSDG